VGKIFGSARDPGWGRYPIIWGGESGDEIIEKN
jgi:hypothetical protein